MLSFSLYFWPQLMISTLSRRLFHEFLTYSWRSKDEDKSSCVCYNRTTNCSQEKVTREETISFIVQLSNPPNGGDKLLFLRGEICLCKNTLLPPISTHDFRGLITILSFSCVYRLIFVSFLDNTYILDHFNVMVLKTTALTKMNQFFLSYDIYIKNQY